MPRRPTTLELANRIDGLALGFFAAMSALCTALIGVHPDEEGVIDSMRDEALAMLAMLDDIEQEVFPPEAIGHAFTAVVAAFVSRADEEAGEATNDNLEL